MFFNFRNKIRRMRSVGSCAAPPPRLSTARSGPSAPDVARRPPRHVRLGVKGSRPAPAPRRRLKPPKTAPVRVHGEAPSAEERLRVVRPPEGEGRTGEMTNGRVEGRRRRRGRFDVPRRARDLGVGGPWSGPDRGARQSGAGWRARAGVGSASLPVPAPGRPRLH